MIFINATRLFSFWGLTLWDILTNLFCFFSHFISDLSKYASPSFGYVVEIFYYLKFWCTCMRVSFFYIISTFVNSTFFFCWNSFSKNEEKISSNVQKKRHKHPFLMDAINYMYVETRFEENNTLGALERDIQWENPGSHILKHTFLNFGPVSYFVHARNNNWGRPPRLIGFYFRNWNTWLLISQPKMLFEKRCLALHNDESD